uniref:Insulin-like growth factor 2 n=1 Tax=Ornithorhynchus anatinus TaxID=9258 RepID=A0A6I8PJ87_ORNAN
MGRGGGHRSEAGGGGEHWSGTGGGGDAGPGWVVGRGAGRGHVGCIPWGLRGLCRVPLVQGRRICPLWRWLLFTLTCLVYTAATQSPHRHSQSETLCGGELVDTLQFVCGDRGFYFGRSPSRTNRRSKKGIVEECCFSSCDLALLETYCATPAKSERDVSVSSTTDYQKSSSTKFFRDESWQKSAHRLRRGAPAQARLRRFRPLADPRHGSQLFRPLGPLPGEQPLFAQASSETLQRRE